ncbi:MAG: DUF5694 domain-containing protein [Gammaproteobacteria bacterium]|nr:DUF5694 domain-containing protein [Gammaproteobacteria bacterium]
MRNIAKYIAAAFLFASPLAATAEQQPPAQVMLFGVFHFSNPGRDMVKTDQMNVMTNENQAYLGALSAEISKFNPTIVLLEFEPEREPEMQERFRQYLDGTYDLPSNEIYQLGFRIAALSDADTIHGFDETGIQWNAEPLFDYMESNDTETGARMSALIEELTSDAQEEQTRLSLRELLVRYNDPDRDALNRGIYVLTNHVGGNGNFVGADAAASWWHRNFRMYALVQQHALPGERVLVIGGQGHIAILRQLLADDRDREAVDVRPYLNQ